MPRASIALSRSVGFSRQQRGRCNGRRAWQARRHSAWCPGMKSWLTLRSAAARRQDCSHHLPHTCAVYSQHGCIMAPGLSILHAYLGGLTSQLWLWLCRAHQRNVAWCKAYCRTKDNATTSGSLASLAALQHRLRRSAGTVLLLTWRSVTIRRQFGRECGLLGHG